MAVYQQGMSQQTPAIQTLLRSQLGNGAARSTSRTSRRRKSGRTKKAKTKTTRKRRAASGGAARFVKGSAAAKRWMAKIRKMRK